MTQKEAGDLGVQLRIHGAHGFNCSKKEDSHTCVCDENQENKKIDIRWCSLRYESTESMLAL
jgi:hypothetical protein